LQIYEEPSLLSTTFAAIVDQRVDPNSTLSWMNTELGNVWHGPMRKNAFLLCELGVWRGQGAHSRWETP